MLMLFGETNQKESQEFLSTYLGWDVISSHVGWILLLILVHILWTILRSVLCKMRKKMILPKVNQMVPVVCKAVLGVLVAWGLYCSWSECKDNKDAIYQLMTKQTLGEVEHQLTLQPKAELYLPIYRLIFSPMYNVSQAVEHVMAELPESAERDTIVNFIKSSPRGILRGPM